VQNCSGCNQCYSDVNLFCGQVCVSCSQYTVSRCGSACYTACGTVGGGSGPSE
jgi:hypothetical protein